MRLMLAGTLWAAGLWCAPTVAAAQQHAAPCMRDSAHAAAMQAEMMEGDRRLEEKLAEVDRTQGDRKVAAMAGVVRELMAQRRRMHQRMAEHPAGAMPCPAHPGPHRPCPRDPGAGGANGP